MKAHIWLGLLCVPLLALHSGFRWSAGPLSSVLMFVFFVVIASGIWGLALQQVLPKIMLENVPAETIYSQIDRVLAQSTEEAERIVRVTCGREESATGDARRDRTPIRKRHSSSSGARSLSGARSGQAAQTRAQVDRVPGSEALMEFALRRGMSRTFEAPSRRASPATSAKQAKLAFADVRARLNPKAHPVVEVLEELCDQRRQLDLQSRLHVWLHAWLWIHLPLSVALFALMLAHIYFALKYY